MDSEESEAAKLAFYQLAWNHGADAVMHVLVGDLKRGVPITVERLQAMRDAVEATIVQIRDDFGRLN